MEKEKERLPAKKDIQLEGGDEEENTNKSLFKLL